jgi:hypothetical protein
MSAVAQKLLFSQRWKHRRGPRSVGPKPALTTPITPKPPPAPAPPPGVPAAVITAPDQARIARWVAAQIISWAPDNCFCCRRPIVFGAKWTELVNDNDRARFHSDCAPTWRAQQELAARRALGLDRSERE